MKGMSIGVLVVALLPTTVLPGQDLSAVPVFSDDFSVPGLFAEHWDASKGTKCEDGRAVIPSGNQMALRRKPGGDFALTAELMVEKPSDTKGGHCGVILDGIHFMISPSATEPEATPHTAYRVAGEERSRGAYGGSIPGFDFGKPVTITISRIKLGEAHKYSYTVNGHPVDAFIVALPASGEIVFYGYRTSMSVGNFRLGAIQGDASRNLVVNSSFEYLQEGMPIYMKPLTERKFRFEGKWGDFLKAFAIDTTEKVSGRNSARMTLGESFPQTTLPSPFFSNGVGTHNVSVIAKTSVTFSVYLKASQDNFPVTLGIWELWHKDHSKPITISKQWQRYSFTVADPEKGIVRAEVSFKKAGTVWADDLQVEIGSKATPYTPSPLDKDKLAETKESSAMDAETIRAVGRSVSHPKRPNSAPALELYTRYNYYMSENTAVLVGTLHLPDAEKLTGKLSVAGRTFDVAMESAFAFEVPLKDIPIGEHPITLDVYKGADKLASGTAKLVKREARPGATQIDRQRRCLVVDGKPYLVLAPFFGMEPALAAKDQDRVLRNMLRLHKEMGYRCFHVGAKDDPPFNPEQTQAFYRLCAEEGIKIIHWSFNGWAAVENSQKRFRMPSSENIIAWQVLDEPEISSIRSEAAEAFLAAQRAASPYTPVFMNNTLIGIPARYANLTTDVLMLDDYLTNREHRKVAEMIDATEMMMGAGSKDRQPVFYFLAGENLPNHYRECSYAEQVAQTYGVIIAGARGVSYFCSLPLYSEDYRACVDVNRELLDLEDVIFSLEKTSSAAVSNPAVRFMTRKLGEELFVIALNSGNDRGVKAEITLPVEFKYGAIAEVKFENRATAIRNGKISDAFKPLGRHVYVAHIVK